MYWRSACLSCGKPAWQAPYKYRNVLHWSVSVEGGRKLHAGVRGGMGNAGI